MRALLWTLCLFLGSLEAAYKLSICTIFKNEERAFKEWLEFHKLQGVEHFFLYNNNSTDGYLAVLTPYILSGEVTLVDWPYTYKPAQNGAEAEQWLAIQSGAYTDCLQKYGMLTEWLAFIDMDEFLFCPTGKRLPDFLDDYVHYGGIGVNWLLFGDSDVEALAYGELMIEKLTRCAPRAHARNRRIKSIVQPRFTRKAKNAHAFAYKKGYFAVDSAKNQLDGSISSPTLHIDEIRINHYWMGVKSHWREKAKTRTNRRAYNTRKELEEQARDFNRYEDHAILQYVPQLKENLFPKGAQ